MFTTLLSSLLLALAPCAASAQGSPDERLQRANALLQSQDYYGAAELLDELTQDQPKNARAWYLLGYALHAAGDLETAVEIHAKAAEFPSVRANASYNAACAEARRGNKSEALDWLERSVEAGYRNLSQLETDPDLASVRSDPRFAKLLPVGQPASFVEKLVVHTTLDGEARGDRFGWIGRNAGDVDGDGACDLWLSAPFKNLGGPAAGRVYLYSGRTGELIFQRDGRPGYQLGIGIECAGDVDKDGVPDLIAGAVGAGGTGMAFIYSGKDGAVLHRLEGEAAGDNFGRKVAGAGDQDGDGHADVIVGAPNFDGEAGADSGRAYVFSGRTGKVLVRLDGERAGDQFGRAVDAFVQGKVRRLVIGAPNAGEGNRGCVYVYDVGKRKHEEAFRITSQPGDVNLGYMFVSAVGDLDGDGHMDVYGSDWNSNAGGKTASGRIYVHSGKTGKRLLELAGESPGDGFGIGTAEAGDVDGDGCDDLLVGAWQSAVGASGGGRCYLYSGKTGALMRTYTCSTPAETFGFDTTGLGDVNGDGVIDFLITAADSYVKGRNSGRVFVVSAAVE